MSGGSGVQEKRLDLVADNGAQILTLPGSCGLRAATRNKPTISRISEALRTKRES